MRIVIRLGGPAMQTAKGRIKKEMTTKDRRITDCPYSQQEKAGVTKLEILFREKRGGGPQPAWGGRLDGDEEPKGSSTDGKSPKLARKEKFASNRGEEKKVLRGVPRRREVEEREQNKKRGRRKGEGEVLLNW